MEPEEELCLCFHVTRRKVANYLRIEKPKRVAQLSECYGAGTGCGWCRPFLQRMFEAATRGDQTSPELPNADEYAQQRSKYVRSGRGTPPPGAGPGGIRRKTCCRRRRDRQFGQPRGTSSTNKRFLGFTFPPPHAKLMVLGRHVM